MRWGFQRSTASRPALKFFDYGVVSLALSRPFSGDWPALIAFSQQYIENEALEQCAEDVCRDICRRFSQRVRRLRASPTCPRTTWSLR